jgi:hypothetical protein
LKRITPSRLLTRLIRGKYGKGLPDTVRGVFDRGQSHPADGQSCDAIKSRQGPWLALFRNPACAKHRPKTKVSISPVLKSESFSSNRRGLVCVPQMPLQRENRTMNAARNLKSVIGALTEIGLMLLALAIVCALLVGNNLPFFGSVVANITALVSELGKNGLVGLIALGIILWLFSKRTMA